MAIKLNRGLVNSTIDSVSSIPHGTYHLADNPSLYEIQRSNSFEFIVTNLNGITRAGALGVESQSTIANAEEILRLSVTSASVPHFSQQPITVKRGNSTIKFAGTPEFSSGKISVVDWIGADTKAILMAWQAKSYNTTTEKVGLVEDYKRDAWLIEYTPDFQEVRRWRLHGCWISGLSESDYNAENADKRMIDVTIEYDRAEIDMSEVQ